jgi:hypothetical protein
MFQSHTEAGKCVLVSGAAHPGPSDIKVWTYTPICVIRTIHCLLSSHEVQVTSSRNESDPNLYKTFLKRSLWWSWQICLTFMVVSLVNISKARLSSAVDYLKASPLACLLESMSPHKYNMSTNLAANMTANVSIFYPHHKELVTIFLYQQTLQ